MLAAESGLAPVPNTPLHLDLDLAHASWTSYTQHSDSIQKGDVLKAGALVVAIHLNAVI